MPRLKFQFTEKERKKLKKINEELSEIVKKYGFGNSSLEFYIITPDEAFLDGDAIGLLHFCGWILDGALRQRQGYHIHFDKFSHLTELSDSLTVSNLNLDEFPTDEKVKEWKEEKKLWIKNAEVQKTKKKKK